MEKLFETIKIGRIELRNRLVYPPMGTRWATGDGFANKRIIEYFEERAKGGVGLLIVGVVSIDRVSGGWGTHCLCIDDDKYIPMLKELTRAIKARGGKVAIQLGHRGAIATRAITGVQPMGPSSHIPMGISTIGPGITVSEVPRELTIREIEGFVEKFTEAVRRAKKAGFDFVEFHGTHNLLINQFLSPWWNKRNDKFGGDFEGRMRFLLEIIEGTKKKVGDEFPIICRIPANEFVEGGLTLFDAKRIAERLEEIGVEAIHVDANMWGISALPSRVPCGWSVPYAEAIKKVVNIPIFASCRIATPELAEKIIEEGKADLVCLGRALIADPYLPKKAAEGRLEDIRPCLVCRLGCARAARRTMTCCVNPAVGREEELRIRPANRQKDVLVVGGGPGGMESARVAALRGYRVTLFEENNELGGQLKLASVPPNKSEYQDLLNYLKTQVRQLDVEIELGRKVGAGMVEEINPDVTIVATGAEPLIPEIPGVNREKVVTALDVLADKAMVGRKIAVIGGGLIGCETASYLLSEDKEVTIITRRDKQDLARSDQIDSVSRLFLLRELCIPFPFPLYNPPSFMSPSHKCVEVVDWAELQEISERGLVIDIGTYGERMTVEVDTIVVARGMRARTELIEGLKSREVPNIYAIGDCVNPRNILHAIHEAYEIAIKI